jgi:hypothetical protein
LQEKIKLQIQHNAAANLLALPEQNGFAFTKSVQHMIAQVAQGEWSKEKLEELIGYTVEQVLSAIYRVNQYYHFDNTAQTALRSVYQQLLRDIKAQTPSCIDYALLVHRHYARLQKWLLESCPATCLLYAQKTPLIEQPVVCAEYAAPTQLQVLGINEADLKGPILDIGCGKEQHLVRYLRQKGFDAYGIDREAVPSATVQRGSWLEHAYRPRHWGAIISHLGFSNHFQHQHLLQGRQYLRYAATYVQILYALKDGGSFYYAPGLPFIEVFLDPEGFAVVNKPVEGTSFHASVITRLF